MKKIIPLLSVCLMLCIMASAQTNQANISYHKAVKKEKKAFRRTMAANDVSEEALIQFKKDFPVAYNLQKEHTPQYDIFSFANSRKENVKAYYNSAAELIGTSQYRSYNSLPARIRNKVAAQYKGYSTDQVLFFDDNELVDNDMTLYGTNFDDADNYFIEMHKGTNKIVVKVTPGGTVSFFKKIKN